MLLIIVALEYIYICIYIYIYIYNKYFINKSYNGYKTFIIIYFYIFINILQQIFY